MKRERSECALKNVQKTLLSRNTRVLQFLIIISSRNSYVSRSLPRFVDVHLTRVYFSFMLLLEGVISPSPERLPFSASLQGHYYIECRLFLLRNNALQFQFLSSCFIHEMILIVKCSLSNEAEENRNLID